MYNCVYVSVMYVYIGETRQIPLTFLSPLNDISKERDSKKLFSFVYNMKNFTAISIHITKEDCSLLSLSVEMVLSELRWVSGICLVYYVSVFMFTCTCVLVYVYVCLCVCLCVSLCAVYQSFIT